MGIVPCVTHFGAGANMLLTGYAATAMLTACFSAALSKEVQV